jgi:hypothetical protein
MRRVGTALLVAGICAACGSSRPAPPLHIANAYLGLDCGDAFPCPHLGIALWLKTPARNVTVTIHGRRVALSTHYDHRRDWIGFVRDPMAERLGKTDDMRRTIGLTVEATGPDGIVRRATLRRPVSPGWG